MSVWMHPVCEPMLHLMRCIWATGGWQCKLMTETGVCKSSFGGGSSQKNCKSAFCVFALAFFFAKCAGNFKGWTESLNLICSTNTCCFPCQVAKQSYLQLAPVCYKARSKQTLSAQEENICRKIQHKPWQSWKCSKRKSSVTVAWCPLLWCHLQSWSCLTINVVQKSKTGKCYTKLLFKCFEFL